MIIAADDDLTMSHAFIAHIVWMHEQPLTVGKTYDFKLGTTFTSGQITEIVHQIDVNTLATSATDSLPLNGIALCRVQLTRAVAFDSYALSKATGNLIVIDRLSNITVGAGMVQERAKTLSDIEQLPAVTATARARRLGHASLKLVVEASGARELAELIERVLFQAGALPVVVNADDAAIDALQAAGLLVIVADEVVGERSLRIRGSAEAIAPVQLTKSNSEAAEQVLKLLREQGLMG